jgi:hypothetical protein
MSVRRLRRVRRLCAACAACVAVVIVTARAVGAPADRGPSEECKRHAALGHVGCSAPVYASGGGGGGSASLLHVPEATQFTVPRLLLL